MESERRRGHWPAGVDQSGPEDGCVSGISSAVRFTFDVPAGWEGFSSGGLAPVDVGTGPPSGMALGFGNRIGSLYSDPCHGTDGDIPTGTTVDELVAAFRQSDAGC